jgi:UDP-N-acetylglucosamine 4,6-dehydratase/5-epimerase
LKYICKRRIRVLYNEKRIEGMVKIETKLKLELKNKTILITGGAGSIGFHLTRRLLEYPVKSIRVLDIDENALFQLGRKLNSPKVRLLLGNILDKERVDLAMNDVDYVFHLAAIKNIEISEFNPIETIDSNINGTVNLIKSAMRNKPKKFLNISTDKAVEPTTLYGTTKLLNEKLTTWAGQHNEKIKFGTIRLGNVFESRGNVFDVWNEEMKVGNSISITDPNMERYYFHISNAVEFILNSIQFINEGEIIVPKMKLYKIKDLASKVSNKQKIIGVRRGEKMKEKLISEVELKFVKNMKNMWIIRPKHNYKDQTS